MSPAAAARSILLTTSCVFLEPETGPECTAECAGVGRHLPDDRGGLLLPIGAGAPLVQEVRGRGELPAVALAIDVPRSPATRRPLPRLQLTGWLSLTPAETWLHAGGRPLADEAVLTLDPQIVVLVTDHGPVEVDLDEYQEVASELLRVRRAA
jgi:hypothetical protein